MASSYSRPTRSCDYLFKIVIIGDSHAGKSCLMNRFADNEFSSSFISTVGIDFKVKTIELEGKKIKIQIYDTAGQCRFRTLSRAYYRGANGCILAYDSSERESFDHIEYWLEQIRMYSTKAFVPIIVGNKIDLIKKVQTDELKVLSEKFNCRVFETSAKENIGVDLLFKELISDMLKASTTTITLPAPAVELSAEAPKTRKCCS